MWSILGMMLVAVAVVTLLYTRYEAPSSVVKDVSALNTHFEITRKWVQIYLDSNDISTLNYRNILDDNIISSDIAGYIGGDDIALGTDNHKSIFNLHTVKNVTVHVVPDLDSPGNWIFAFDFRSNPNLMPQATFVEELFARQYCVKNNYGVSKNTYMTFDTATKKYSNDGTASDGIVLCSIPE